MGKPLQPRNERPKKVVIPPKLAVYAEADWAPLEGRKALNAWCDAREVWARENLVDPEHDDPDELDIICENAQMRRRGPAGERRRRRDAPWEWLPR